MNVMYYPEEFASVYQPAIFRLDDVRGDSTGLVLAEVLIGNTTESDGEKHYRKRQSIDVDVAPYARSFVEVEPLRGRGLVNATKRSVDVSVRVGGDCTQRVRLATGAQTLPQGVLLSDIAQRVIAPGERDEIAFIPALGEMWISLKATDKQGKLYDWQEPSYSVDSKTIKVYVVDASAIMNEVKTQWGVAPEEIRQIEVFVRWDGMEQIAVRYEVRQSGRGVRLSWVNPYGAIDYYTFPTVHTKSIDVKRKGSVEELSLRPLPLSAWREWSISSEIMPARQIEWLAQIAVASKVWMVEAGTYTSCDVLTQRLEVDNIEAPCALNFVVRPQEKIATQCV